MGKQENDDFNSVGNVFVFYNKGEIALVTSLEKNLPNSEVMLLHLVNLLMGRFAPLYPHYRFFFGLIYNY
jgi:hypothetical protein